jgi:UDP-N-acetyl-D-mannosaminuronic acid transferase (WecB/TagA/CpsF family)
MNFRRHRVPVLGVQVDVLDWAGAIERIAAWGRAAESRYVCFSNVHSAVTASLDCDFHQVLADSDLCTSDGAPVTPNAVVHHGIVDPGIHLLVKPFGQRELAQAVRAALDE